MDVDRELEGIRTLDLEGGDERLVALLASDCVYHEDPHWLDGRVFRGRDEIAAIHSEYRELWGTRELRIEAAERVGLAIVASFRQRGVTPKGGVPFEQVWTYVFRARDGLIVEMWAFSNRDEAHEKAAAIR